MAIAGTHILSIDLFIRNRVNRQNDGIFLDIAFCEYLLLILTCTCLSIHLCYN